MNDTNSYKISGETRRIAQVALQYHLDHARACMERAANAGDVGNTDYWVRKIGEINAAIAELRAAA